MAHFAHVNNGIVDSVIVISRETLTQANGWYCTGCGEHKPLEEWVQTSYNVASGEYRGDEVVKTALAAQKQSLSLSKGMMIAEPIEQPVLDAMQIERIGDDEDMKARNRMHYAGIGYSYDADNDRFIPPQPFASWTLDESTCLWVAPKAMPQDGEFYKWNEELLDWVILK